MIPVLGGIVSGLCIAVAAILVGGYTRSRCPHQHIRGIYGDEILHANNYRLQCKVCGRLLDGPVSLNTDQQDLRDR